MSRYGDECASHELSVQSRPMWKVLVALLVLGVGAAALWVNAGRAEGPAIEIGGPEAIGQTGEVAVKVTGTRKLPCWLKPGVQANHPVSVLSVAPLGSQVAANSNVTGLATRELLPFRPFRSSCIVTLAFSTIIF